MSCHQNVNSSSNGVRDGGAGARWNDEEPDEECVDVEFRAFEGRIELLVDVRAWWVVDLDGVEPEGTYSSSIRSSFRNDFLWLRILSSSIHSSRYSGSEVMSKKLLPLGLSELEKDDELDDEPANEALIVRTSSAESGPASWRSRD